MKKIIVCLGLAATASLFSYNIQAQEPVNTQDSIATEKKNFLEGLRMVDWNEFDKDLPWDKLTELVPFYTTEGKRLTKDEAEKIFDITQYLHDNNIYLQPYSDENRKLKAFVLRPMTEEEIEVHKKSIKEIEEFIALHLGKMARPFSVSDIHGNEYSLELLNGKVVVINFWFIGCPPCIREIPTLNELVKKFQGKDVVFLGFALDDKGALESFLQKKDFKYHLIPKSWEISKSYGVFNYPSHLIVDKNSIVTYVATGIIGTDKIKEIEKEIEKLLEE